MEKDRQLAEDDMYDIRKYQNKSPLLAGHDKAHATTSNWGTHHQR